MPIEVVIDDWSRVSARIKANFRQDVIYGTAEFMRDRAIRYCPVSDISEPGYTHLYETIRVVGVNQYAADVVAGDTRLDVDYAPYPEFGTYKMAARPYMRPAATDAARELDRRIGRLT